MTYGARALLIVAGSALSGALYFSYLRSEPFPPDVVRVVPLAWLTACAAGWILVVAGLRFDNRKLPAIAGLLLERAEHPVGGNLCARRGNGRLNREARVRLKADTTTAISTSPAEYKRRR